MNIRMSTTHVKTLCKLKALAEKHNCEIRFGLQQNAMPDFIDWDFIKKESAMPDFIKEELERGLSIETSFYQLDVYYFELYDKNNETYSMLRYIAIRNYFNFLVYVEDLSEEAAEWIENNASEGYYACSNAYDKISGFKGIDTSFVNVYREGMLLKFFGDLVCDYLGEERIHEVY